MSSKRGRTTYEGMMSLFTYRIYNETHFSCSLLSITAKQTQFTLIIIPKPLENSTHKILKIKRYVANLISSYFFASQQLNRWRISWRKHVVIPLMFLVYITELWFFRWVFWPINGKYDDFFGHKHTMTQYQHCQWLML